MGNESHDDEFRDTGFKFVVQANPLELFEFNS